MQTHTHIKIILQYDQLTKHFNILGKICSNLQLQIDLLYIISIIIITIIYMETADLVQENSTTKKNKTVATAEQSPLCCYPVNNSTLQYMRVTMRD